MSLFQDKKLQILRGKSFLSIDDFDSYQISSLIDLAIQIKNKKVNFDFSNRVLGLIFEKSSTRTRVSFQVAMQRLNGECIEINPTNSQIGRGEPIRDTVRVLERYVDVLAIRTFEQNILDEYKKWSSIPIINALSDLEHPCQVLADFMTIKEEFGSFDDLTISYIGDPNNVSNSLMLCAALLNIKINIGCPQQFMPSKDILTRASQLSKNDKLINIFHDSKEAVRNSNVIYTDVWSSMGQESQADNKEKFFKNFIIDKNLVENAASKHIIMHCLPAYRGKEISAETFESDASRIFIQAENRLHSQQALLALVL